MVNFILNLIARLYTDTNVRFYVFEIAQYFCQLCFIPAVIYDVGVKKYIYTYILTYYCINNFTVSHNNIRYKTFFFSPIDFHRKYSN